MTLITSRENPAVRDFVKLNTSSGYRRSAGRFALEGARLAEDAARSGVRVENAFFTPQAAEKHRVILESLEKSGAKIYGIEAALAERISDTRSTQGILCTAFMLDNRIDMDKIDISGVYLALQNLQDPGNMGTILRTAEALKVDGVLLSPGCVDVYSPKVVRSAMGAVFRVPFVKAADFTQTLAALAQRGLRTYAAVADSAADDILQEDFSGGAVAVIGNEGNGLTEDCISCCEKRITIRMRGRAESLNAAAAATIILWELTRRRQSDG